VAAYLRLRPHGQWDFLIFNYVTEFLWALWDTKRLNQIFVGVFCSAVIGQYYSLMTAARNEILEILKLYSFQRMLKISHR